MMDMSRNWKASNAWLFWLPSRVIRLKLNFQHSHKLFIRDKKSEKFISNIQQYSCDSLVYFDALQPFLYVSVFSQLLFMTLSEIVSISLRMQGRNTCLFVWLIGTVIRCWEKSRSQSSTFWHIWEKHGFHFLMRKLSISIKWLVPRTKLTG